MEETAPHQPEKTEAPQAPSPKIGGERPGRLDGTEMVLGDLGTQKKLAREAKGERG
ncbi:MAG: hypothetical protein HY093_03920 [Candidatus Liptonbacteria bacterium]|nr:hypothetical protein [Candidatus Liptonbacteria bacterium]